MLSAGLILQIIMKRMSVVLRLTICCLFSAFQAGRSRHAHILEQPGVMQTTYYEINFQPRLKIRLILLPRNLSFIGSYKSFCF